MATVVNMKGWSPIVQIGNAIGQGLQAYVRARNDLEEENREAKRRKQEIEDNRAFQLELQAQSFANATALQSMANTFGLLKSKELQKSQDILLSNRQRGAENRKIADKEEEKKMVREADIARQQKDMQSLSILSINVDPELIKSSAAKHADIYANLLEELSIPDLSTIASQLDPVADAAIEMSALLNNASETFIDPEDAQQLRDAQSKIRRTYASQAIPKFPIAVGTDEAFFGTRKEVTAYIPDKLKADKLREEVKAIIITNNIAKDKATREGKENEFRTSMINTIAADIRSNDIYDSFIDKDTRLDKTKARDIAEGIYDKYGTSVNFISTVLSKGGFIRANANIEKLSATDFSPVPKAGFSPTNVYFKTQKGIQDIISNVKTSTIDKQSGRVKSYLQKVGNISGSEEVPTVYGPNTANFQRLDEWSRNMDSKRLQELVSDRIGADQTGILAQLSKTGIAQKQIEQMAITVMSQYEKAMLDTKAPNEHTINSHADVLNATTTILLDKLSKVIDNKDIIETVQKSIKDKTLLREIAGVVQGKPASNTFLELGRIESTEISTINVDERVNSLIGRLVKKKLLTNTGIVEQAINNVIRDSRLNEEDAKAFRLLFNQLKSSLTAL